MIRFLEHPSLSRLSALLDYLDVGDRILSGRFELFSSREDQPETEDESGEKETKREIDENEKPREQQQAQQTSSANGADSNTSACSSGTSLTTNVSGSENDTEKAPEDRLSIVSSSPSLLDANSSLSVLDFNSPPPSRKRSQSRQSVDLSVSPSKRRKSSWELLGTHNQAEARKLLVQLVSTMNACFPDYDFSSVIPEAFELENFVTVYTTINYHLSFLVERIIPGFLQDLWASIKDAINLRNVSVYSYSWSRDGRVESDPHVDDALCLFSFDYFFVDASSNKILFFTCMTKRKLPTLSFENDAMGRDEDQTRSSNSSSDFDYSSDDEECEEPVSKDEDNDDDNDDDDDNLLYGEIAYE